jgi:hypothetical protein
MKPPKRKPYLTAAGRRWLNDAYERMGHGPRDLLLYAIGEELVENEGGPPRKRGRPTAEISREDRKALDECDRRIREYIAKNGRRPNYNSVLRTVARELDQRDGWCGEPDARYRRLKRCPDRYLRRYLEEVENEPDNDLMLVLVNRYPDDPDGQ